MSDDEKNENGHTPAQIAAAKAFMVEYRALLAKHGADIYACGCCSSPRLDIAGADFPYFDQNEELRP